MEEDVIIDTVNVYDCEFYSPIQHVMRADGSIEDIEHACLKNMATETCCGKECYYKKYYQNELKYTGIINGYESVLDGYRLENEDLHELIEKINDLMCKAPSVIRDECVELIESYTERKQK